ncbi:MAG: TRAM domain-containing protein [Candidatus Paceibacteria bacterium]
MIENLEDKKGSIQHELNNLSPQEKGDILSDLETFKESSGLIDESEVSETLRGILDGHGISLDDFLWSAHEDDFDAVEYIEDLITGEFREEAEGFVSSEKKAEVIDWLLKRENGYQMVAGNLGLAARNFNQVDTDELREILEELRNNGVEYNSGENSYVVSDLSRIEDYAEEEGLTKVSLTEEQVLRALYDADLDSATKEDIKQVLTEEFEKLDEESWEELWEEKIYNSGNGWKQDWIDKGIIDTSGEHSFEQEEIKEKLEKWSAEKVVSKLPNIGLARDASGEIKIGREVLDDLRLERLEVGFQNAKDEKEDLDFDIDGVTVEFNNLGQVEVRELLDAFKEIVEAKEDFSVADDISEILSFRGELQSHELDSQRYPDEYSEPIYDEAGLEMLKNKKSNFEQKMEEYDDNPELLLEEYGLSEECTYQDYEDQLEFLEEVIEESERFHEQAADGLNDDSNADTEPEPAPEPNEIREEITENEFSEGSIIRDVKISQKKEDGDYYIETTAGNRVYINAGVEKGDVVDIKITNVGGHGSNGSAEVIGGKTIDSTKFANGWLKNHKYNLGDTVKKDELSLFPDRVISRLQRAGVLESVEENDDLEEDEYRIVAEKDFGEIKESTSPVEEGETFRLELKEGVYNEEESELNMFNTFGGFNLKIRNAIPSDYDETKEIEITGVNTQDDVAYATILPEQHEYPVIEAGEFEQGQRYTQRVVKELEEDGEKTGDGLVKINGRNVIVKDVFSDDNDYEVGDFVDIEISEVVNPQGFSISELAEVMGERKVEELSEIMGDIISLHEYELEDIENENDFPILERERVSELSSLISEFKQIIYPHKEHIENEEIKVEGATYTIDEYEQQLNDMLEANIDYHFEQLPQDEFASREELSDWLELNLFRQSTLNQEKEPKVEVEELRGLISENLDGLVSKLIENKFIKQEEDNFYITDRFKKVIHSESYKTILESLDEIENAPEEIEEGKEFTDVEIGSIDNNDGVIELEDIDYKLLVKNTPETTNVLQQEFGKNNFDEELVGAKVDVKIFEPNSGRSPAVREGFAKVKLQEVRDYDEDQVSAPQPEASEINEDLQSAFNYIKEHYEEVDGKFKKEDLNINRDLLNQLISYGVLLSNEDKSQVPEGEVWVNGLTMHRHDSLEDIIEEHDSPVEEGRTYEKEITEEGREGDGIARFSDNFIVFVEGAEKGETVEFEVEDVKPDRGIAFAKLPSETTREANQQTQETGPDIEVEQDLDQALEWLQDNHEEVNGKFKKDNLDFEQEVIDDLIKYGILISNEEDRRDNRIPDDELWVVGNRIDKFDSIQEIVDEIPKLNQKFEGRVSETDHQGRGLIQHGEYEVIIEGAEMGDIIEYEIEDIDDVNIRTKRAWANLVSKESPEDEGEEGEETDSENEDLIEDLDRALSWLQNHYEDRGGKFEQDDLDFEDEVVDRLVELGILVGHDQHQRVPEGEIWVVGNRIDKFENVEEILNETPVEEGETYTGEVEELGPGDTGRVYLEDGFKVNVEGAEVGDRVKFEVNELDLRKNRAFAELVSIEETTEEASSESESVDVEGWDIDSLQKAEEWLKVIATSGITEFKVEDGGIEFDSSGIVVSSSEVKQGAVNTEIDEEYLEQLVDRGLLKKDGEKYVIGEEEQERIKEVVDTSRMKKYYGEQEEGEVDIDERVRDIYSTLLESGQGILTRFSDFNYYGEQKRKQAQDALDYLRQIDDKKNKVEINGQEIEIEQIWEKIKNNLRKTRENQNDLLDEMAVSMGDEGEPEEEQEPSVSKREVERAREKFAAAREKLRDAKQGKFFGLFKDQQKIREAKRELEEAEEEYFELRAEYVGGEIEKDIDERLELAEKKRDKMLENQGILEKVGSKANQVLKWLGSFNVYNLSSGEKKEKQPDEEGGWLSAAGEFLGRAASVRTASTIALTYGGFMVGATTGVGFGMVALGGAMRFGGGKDLTYNLLEMWSLSKREKTGLLRDVSRDELQNMSRDRIEEKMGMIEAQRASGKIKRIKNSRYRDLYEKLGQELVRRENETANRIENFLDKQRAKEAERKSESAIQELSAEKRRQSLLSVAGGSLLAYWGLSRGAEAVAGSEEGAAQSAKEAVAAGGATEELARETAQEMSESAASEVVAEGTVEKGEGFLHAVNDIQEEFGKENLAEEIRESHDKWGGLNDDQVIHNWRVLQSEKFGIDPSKGFKYEDFGLLASGDGHETTVGMVFEDGEPELKVNMFTDNMDVKDPEAVHNLIESDDINLLDDSGEELHPSSPDELVSMIENGGGQIGQEGATTGGAGGESAEGQSSEDITGGAPPDVGETVSAATEAEEAGTTGKAIQFDWGGEGVEAIDLFSEEDFAGDVSEQGINEAQTQVLEAYQEGGAEAAQQAAERVGIENPDEISEKMTEALEGTTELGSFEGLPDIRNDILIDFDESYNISEILETEGFQFSEEEIAQRVFGSEGITETPIDNEATRELAGLDKFYDGITDMVSPEEAQAVQEGMRERIKDLVQEYPSLEYSDFNPDLIEDAGLEEMLESGSDAIPDTDVDLLKGEYWGWVENNPDAEVSKNLLEARTQLREALGTGDEELIKQAKENFELAKEEVRDIVDNQ